MVTSRDRTLLIFLMVQAAIDAAAMSAHLVEIAPRPVIAGVGLISAMLSAATGVYVVATREREFPANGLLTHHDQQRRIRPNAIPETEGGWE